MKLWIVVVAALCVAALFVSADSSDSVRVSDDGCPCAHIDDSAAPVSLAEVSGSRLARVNWEKKVAMCPCGGIFPI